MIAVDLMTKDYREIYVKKIKFQPRPSPDELLKQLQALDKKFEDIFSAVTNTCIKLSKRIASHDKVWKNKNGQKEKKLCK